MIKSIFTIILSLTLSACGFQPVYKTMDKALLPPIDIAQIDSVDGSELYNELTHLVNSSAGADYKLEIKMKYSSSSLAITKTSDVIEQNAVQSISYKLTNTKTNKSASGSFSVKGSYNVTASAYDSHTEERQEKMDLARMAADEMHHRLILYFSGRHHEESKTTS